MKDLNSPFKMEHFEYNHILTLSRKAQKFFQGLLAPKLAVPFCHKLLWVGGSRKVWVGGGGCVTSTILYGSAEMVVLATTISQFCRLCGAQIFQPFRQLLSSVDR